MTKNENFKIAIEGDYSDEIIESISEVIEKKVPDACRNKIFIIEMLDI